MGRERRKEEKEGHRLLIKRVWNDSRMGAMATFSGWLFQSVMVLGKFLRAYLLVVGMLRLCL